MRGRRAPRDCDSRSADEFSRERFSRRAARGSTRSAVRTGLSGRSWPRFDPAVGVAADPLGLELLQPRHGLRGCAPDERVVAAQHEPLGARCARVCDHRVERGEVPVDVVEKGPQGRRLPVALRGVPLAGPGRKDQQDPRVGDRAHLVALVRGGERQRAGAAPPLPAESSISTSPSTTTIHARSCTWWSSSSSPAGRLMTIVRPSSSDWRTFG